MDILSDYFPNMVRQCPVFIRICYHYFKYCSIIYVINTLELFQVAILKFSVIWPGMYVQLYKYILHDILDINTLSQTPKDIILIAVPQAKRLKLKDEN